MIGVRSVKKLEFEIKAFEHLPMTENVSARSQQPRSRLVEY